MRTRTCTTTLFNKKCGGPENIGLWSGIVHMTEPIPAQLGKFIRGISVRQVRLACGFVLFAYLVSHFLNHALGNISLGAMAKGIEYHKAFWQLLPVAIVFYSAAAAHTGLG